MTDIEHFAASTRLFNESKFLEGLEQIDRCIQQDPNSSVLYSNRALFLVEIGHVRQAIKDLKHSIELDYLNYISYFNLFSVHIRQHNLELAIQDLHCALSAIYLIAARQTKSYEFVTKAVQYAKNNTEARVLKGLMELEQGKFKEAHEQLVWACGIETDSIMLSRVRDLIKKIGESAEKNPEEQSSTNSQRKETRRLQSAFDTHEYADLELQIRDRVIQFNQIYQIISEKQGLVTEKIGQRGDKKEIFIRQKSVSSQHSKSQRTDPEKEMTYHVEVTEEKSDEAISNQVIDEVVQTILGPTQSTKQQQETPEVLESAPVQSENHQETQNQAKIPQQNNEQQTVEQHNKVPETLVLQSSPQQTHPTVFEQMVEYVSEKAQMLEDYVQKHVQPAIQEVTEKVEEIVEKIIESVHSQAHEDVLQSQPENIQVEDINHQSNENQQTKQNENHQHQQ